MNGLNKLTDLFSGFDTFIFDNTKLKLGVGVDIPCYTGNSEQIARIYPGQPVFIVDAVKRVAPFVGCKDISFTQEGDIVHVVAQYEDTEYDEPYEVEYHIKCLIDQSRCDCKSDCTLDKIDKEELIKPKYIDADQSRYIGDVKYFVTDLFRLGRLNSPQRKQLEALFRKLNGGQIHKYSSTIYYTDTGEWGLWDYLKAKPYNLC